MAERGAVDWLLVAICVVTYGLLAGELARIVRRVLRLMQKVERITESPAFVAAPKAAMAVDRIANASIEAQALLMRAAWAIERIRATIVAVAGFARSVTGR